MKLPLDQINNSKDLVCYFKTVDGNMQMRLVINLGDKLAAIISNLDQLASLFSVSQYKSISVIIDRLDKHFFNMIANVNDLDKILQAAPQGSKGLIINIMADRLQKIILNVEDLQKIHKTLDTELV